MGLVDELGSGVRNIYKYSNAYFGFEPELIEGNIFKIIFRTKKVTQQVTQQVEDRVSLLLEYCKEPRTRDEMQKKLGLKDREYFRSTILKPLLEEGKLMLTIPDKPNSSKQKYVSKSTGLGD